MRKHILFLLLVALHSQLTIAQTLKGQLTEQAGQKITLTGFNYYKSYSLATTTIDSTGNFTLNYPKTYKGMGILQTQDNSRLLLALTENNIALRGNRLNQLDGITFTKGAMNNKLTAFVKQDIENAQAYNGWRYLQPLYSTKQNLKTQTEALAIINKEIQRIEHIKNTALKDFPKESYLHWFLPKKVLIHDMPASAKQYTERIPQNIQAFRAMDFADNRFKTSGLLKPLIEGHYMLLQSMGQPLDKVYQQMNVSTDHIIETLRENDSLLNEVGKELFNYFEKRSLLDASEYLSVMLLNNNQCALDDKLTAKLESYRKMKPGNIASDIQLSSTKKLSDIKTTKLVIFGASWCPHCADDIPVLEEKCKAWKEKNIEIVYISVDTDKKAFNTTYNNKPWQTYCDFKGWQTQAAKDFYVVGTPTFFLLDANNKILIRPKSIAHADAWITYELTRGKK